MEKITVLPGRDKSGHPENFDPVELERGGLYTIVGDTGSGKSRLIKDIEQLADGDSVTERRILLDGLAVPMERRIKLSSSLVAHLGQNMRFMMDSSVGEFISLHARCRGKEPNIDSVLAIANDVASEEIDAQLNLNLLSGGQARALMAADIALICDSPVVLIDEIENAGIDKERALNLLLGNDKLVLVVTHDIHTALMAKTRMVMRGGAVAAVLGRSTGEEVLYKKLGEEYRVRMHYRELLRKGEQLA